MSFQFKEALDDGYSEQEILNFLKKEQPETFGKIQNAIRGGYSANEVFDYYSNEEQRAEKTKKWQEPETRLKALTQKETVEPKEEPSFIDKLLQSVPHVTPSAIPVDVNRQEAFGTELETTPQFLSGATKALTFGAYDPMGEPVTEGGKTGKAWGEGVGTLGKYMISRGLFDKVAPIAGTFMGRRVLDAVFGGSMEAMEQVLSGKDLDASEIGKNASIMALIGTGQDAIKYGMQLNGLANFISKSSGKPKKEVYKFLFDKAGQNFKARFNAAPTSDNFKKAAEAAPKQAQKIWEDVIKETTTEATAAAEGLEAGGAIPTEATQEFAPLSKTFEKAESLSQAVAKAKEAGIYKNALRPLDKPVSTFEEARKVVTNNQFKDSKDSKTSFMSLSDGLNKTKEYSKEAVSDEYKHLDKLYKDEQGNAINANENSINNLFDKDLKAMEDELDKVYNLSPQQKVARTAIGGIERKFRYTYSLGGSNVPDMSSLKDVPLSSISAEIKALNQRTKYEHEGGGYNPYINRIVSALHSVIENTANDLGRADIIQQSGLASDSHKKYENIYRHDPVLSLLDKKSKTPRKSYQNSLTPDAADTIIKELASLDETRHLIYPYKGDLVIKSLGNQLAKPESYNEDTFRESLKDLTENILTDEESERLVDIFNNKRAAKDRLTERKKELAKAQKKAKEVSKERIPLTETSVRKMFKDAESIKKLRNQMVKDGQEPAFEKFVEDWINRMFSGGKVLGRQLTPTDIEKGLNDNYDVLKTLLDEKELKSILRKVTDIIKKEQSELAGAKTLADQQKIKDKNIKNVAYMVYNVFKNMPIVGKYARGLKGLFNVFTTGKKMVRS